MRKTQRFGPRPPPRPQPPNRGVSSTMEPSSKAPPTEKDISLTKSLARFMAAADVYEDRLTTMTKKKVAESLGSLFTEWLDEMCVKMLLGSDIDAVCVGPGFVQRHHFFSSFCRKLAANKEVTDMLAFEKAHVPVMKLTYKGEKMDLVYVQYPEDSVPETVDLMDDDLVRGLDPRCVRSLNGYRDSQQILRCVPNKHLFRTTLRVIKVWAKKRQIYSNRLGFLGGISWAILVARVCQLYPNATVAALVTHFFRLYSTWDWNNPVRLRNENRELPSWDSQAPWSDRFPLMPIMTPAFPQQNSTFNMAKSNMAVITQEFVRGWSITEDVYSGRAEWARLFQMEDLGQKYQVGLVEAKVRILVGYLDKDWQISLVRTIPEPSPEEKSTRWRLGLLLNQEVLRRPLDITAVLHRFTEYVYMFARKCGDLEDGMTLSASVTSRGQQVCRPAAQKRRLSQESWNVAKKAKVDTAEAPELLFTPESVLGRDRLAVSPPPRDPGVLSFRHRRPKSPDTPDVERLDSREKPVQPRRMKSVIKLRRPRSPPAPDAMSDSDDDGVPTLSAHTLAALQEFYSETRTGLDRSAQTSDQFAVGAVEEDWVSSLD
ncbi:poly(A) polymerase type 3-like [Salarias fasciatus]|uniref:poly(A) polymerase type 3-like n=1 Tax=Salarias fasciatus TaxID=181472 RepID=UPI001176C0DC|nr:poly(A) polymerase type 3-like [Salarias fasciatus]